jgi:hypothetical protein
MRVIEIPPFRYRVEISDGLALENLYKTRLGQKVELRAAQAISLLGYMGWPNDTVAREDGMQMLKAWLEGGEDSVWSSLTLMHQHWAGVADTVQLHYAIDHGGHQKARGGTSRGKAVFLASEVIESKGASTSNLWQNWSTYKDVGHLIAAAMQVCADIQERNYRKPLGITLQSLLPVRVVCLVPELIVGVARAYQEYGLNSVNTMFDAETVWRIS